jgi:hypothetical protein
MAAMNLIAQLLSLAEAYSAATGVNLRLLGDRIFGDRRRFEALKAGTADLNTRSFEKAMLWFSANWPEAIDWPDGIERPEPKDEAARQAVEGQGAAA